MILKYLSTNELDFSKSWNVGWAKIKKLSQFDRFMTCFWFLGPFIYLIERDPADVWITFIGITFFIRSIYKKDWAWSKQLWFRFAMLFWLTGIFSALINTQLLFSLKEGFVWIRFPLYAAAAQVWIARDRDIRIIMLLSMLIGMIIICLILISEMILEPKLRLMWPYGDKVPGGYLAKISLPLFCCLMAVASRQFNYASILCGFISIISLIMTFFTGERTHFILRFFSGIMSLIVWRPKPSVIFSIIFIKTILLGIIFFQNPNVFSRFYSAIDNTNVNNLSYSFSKFSSQIPFISTSDENPYWGSWRSGIQQAFETPFVGIGPSGTRNTCRYLKPENMKFLPGKNHCNNHPHNFYIQMFAETGVMGFIFGSLMFINIILICYKAKKIYYYCPIATTSFIVPFAIFFPFQQFGSLFGQWGNLFIWFAIGFAISNVQNWNNDN